MSICSVLTSINDFYIPKYGTYQLYKKQSIYYEFSFATNKIFVVSLNLIDNRIYVYFRNKQPINNLSEIIPGISFIFKNGVYFYNLENLSDVEKSIFMAKTIRFVELYINNFGYDKIKHDIADYTNSKISIIGNYIDSKNNKIISPDNLNNCFVRFLGKNNQLTIHSKANLKNVYIEFMMDNAVVEIDENVRMTGNWRIGHYCTMKIGKNSSSTNPVYITCAEGASVIIGEDCMFATNNQIRTDDAHPIYDVNTGNRINPSKDVILGNHVWIGYGAMLLGGTTVGSGSVIGVCFGQQSTLQ